MSYINRETAYTVSLLLCFVSIFLVAKVAEIKRKKRYKLKIKQLKEDVILMRNREHDEIIKERSGV
jgi:hypothetical protein